jgi:membrane protein
MFKELFTTPTAQLGKAGRFVVFQVKLWSHCARLLRKNRSGQQAAALSYHTIFGIAPLAIVMLLIFQSFSAYEDLGLRFKRLAYRHLNLSEIKFTVQKSKGADEQGTLREEQKLLTDYIDEIVDSFFAGLDKGSLTIVSLVFVLWAALALLSTIEKAFNNIWHVARGRSFLHRVINYWAILTLGPLLIGVAVYVSTEYAAVSQIQRRILSLTQIGSVLLSYLVATTVFFLLYFVLPNTKVQAKAAVWGAVVAALVWTVAKWGFRQYVTEFIPYSAVYGVVGLVPLGVLWIFITWVIVLFGLQLTFTTQYLKTLDAAEMAAAHKREDYFIANDLTVINVARELALAFERNKAPLEMAGLCGKLGIPGEFGEKVLAKLVDKGLIAKTSEPRVGFVPARDPANIRLSDIAEAVAAASFAQPRAEDSPSLERVARSQRELLARYNLKQVAGDDPQTPGTRAGESQQGA